MAQAPFDRAWVGTAGGLEARAAARMESVSRTVATGKIRRAAIR